MRHPEFTELPPGRVRPLGWLARQLRAQADGLTGRLEEIWPDVGPGNAWRGGDGDDWERGPYYLDGLVPLAWVLDDAALQARARVWVDAILGSQRDDGSFGPTTNDDWWPRMVALKALCAYADATDDGRVPEFLDRYFAFQRAELPRRPLAGWGRTRGAENVLAVWWLHERTGDPALRDLAATLLTQTAPWDRHLGPELPGGPVRRFAHATHGPNVAMALKVPAVASLLDDDAAHRARFDQQRARLDERHGLVSGVFSGDEWLAGREPWHGTETCQVVEHLFSLETAGRIWGDAAVWDEVELIAFNALAAACDPHMLAHQYHQQANQVLVSFAQRRWTFSGDDANVFGLEPHYGCCTANLHQGWPKFARSLWALRSGELVALSYAPASVDADVAEGRFAIDVETDYPFEERVVLAVRAAPAGETTLRLRIPGWCSSPTARLEDEPVPLQVHDGYASIRRTWHPGDRLELELAAELRLVPRDRGAVGVRLGALVLAHGIPEIWRPVPGGAGLGEWEIGPRRSWNFGLWTERSDAWMVVRRTPGAAPFAPENPPVTVLAHGARIAEWGLVDSSAGPLPPSPVATEAPIEDIPLVPFGCARIRVAELPVIAPLGDVTTGHEVYA
jgi:hypothetical protein